MWALWGSRTSHVVNDPPLLCWGATYCYVAIEVNFFPNFKMLTTHSYLIIFWNMIWCCFLLILCYRKQINYDLSDCLHASVTELRHICISKRWGSKLPLMKAAKVNINKRILSTLCFFFALLHLSSLCWDEKIVEYQPGTNTMGETPRRYKNAAAFVC